MEDRLEGWDRPRPKNPEGPSRHPEARKLGYPSDDRICFAYLRANGVKDVHSFSVVASVPCGLCGAVYGIPAEQVVGSSGKLKFRSLGCWGWKKTHAAEIARDD